uniref:Uncharacterized protein n=1 Tax=Magallana gigas TaxID=29159 RepID=A0A8W8P175_MAGGI|nr:uncharacterized protein LOC117687017 [Crassostrea gigas]
MTSCVHVSFVLILATILPEILTGDQEKCRKKFHSVEVVASCPTTKREFNIAVRRKNCTNLPFTADKMCSKPYVYHCVINEFRNQTLEVCAPVKFIFDYCTEFNVGGGVIQRHAQVRCNSVFPKCDKKYISSDAYKYPDCYKLANENQAFKSTLSQYPNSGFETRTVFSIEKTTYNETNHKISPTIGAVLIYVATCITFCIALGYFLFPLLRKKLCLCEKTRKNDLEEPNDYIYISTKHLGHFQYVYTLARNCTLRLVNVCTSEDLSDFRSEDVLIRIEVVGDYTEENLKLLSKGKAKRNKRRQKHCDVWKKVPLLCFQNHLSSKSALEMLRKGHACHKILIQSEKYFAKTKKADGDVITVGQNKRDIKEIITTCLETELDQILKVWLKKLKAKGSLNQTLEMIEEIKAIRKQLILENSKSTAAHDVPCIDSKPIVPKNVREHLFRRSGVTGFGIWGCSAFKIFVNMANDDEILKKELIKLNKNFFEKYQLKIETRNMIRLCSTMILHR